MLSSKIFKKVNQFNIVPKKNISILHVSTPNSWRGGEQQLYYLFEELEKNPDVTQYVIANQEGELLKKCNENNWESIGFKKNFATSFTLGKKIKYYCKKLKIDIIHTHDSKAHTAAIIAASIFGNKTEIVVSRRVDFPISSSLSSKQKYNHPKVKKIICVSKAIESIMKPDISNKKILTTIHSGINFDKFKGEFNLDFLRQKFNLPANKTLVGNIAAIAPHKDYYTFIDTVELYCKKNDNAHFLIIGDGPEKDKIVDYCNSKKLQTHITFTGFIPNIIEALKCLNIFLITSETEGLGTSVLDALACKVPVVATNAGGIPEIIIHEKTGLLYDVKNPKQIADGLERLINDIELQEKLKSQGWEHVQGFSKKATAEKTLQEYQNIIQG